MHQNRPFCRWDKIYAMPLHNIYDRETLRKKLAEEGFTRRTVSFYRYVIIDDPEQMRNNLFLSLDILGVLGRIYIAREGINAQISVPEHNWNHFINILEHFNHFKKMPFKFAVKDDGRSFIKLKVKVRPKLVADGLDDDAFDVTNVGRHLSAKEFNQFIGEENTVVVDMRNHYESEVGHFQTAVCPDVDTFRDELPLVEKFLEDKKDKKILLYCTGGIRCEKASAYFKAKGFEDVNQLHGGIIDYVRQVKEQKLENKFIGKNFVFDERMGERISEDVIAQCHQCGEPCDNHTNCANDDCHLLFIQCDACRAKMDGCCTDRCQEVFHMPLEQQLELRRGKIKHDAHSVYNKGRVRPRLSDLRMA